MDNLTTQINELLEACQSEWARLQHPDYTSSPIARHSQQELHRAIKKLVTLQDEAEDNRSRASDPAWADATQSFLDQTKQQLRTGIILHYFTLFSFIALAQSASPFCMHNDLRNYYSYYLVCSTLRG